MKTTVSQLAAALEAWAPKALQESYDNTGLMVGNPSDAVRGVLTTLDVTQEVLQEALDRQCNVVLAHHPLIFSGLKRLAEADATQRLVAFALRNNLNIMALHTSLDNVLHGVNAKLAEKLGLQEPRILDPKQGLLEKLEVYVPNTHVAAVKEALFAVGAGEVGAYDHCSFSVPGTGTFRAGKNANPFVGEPGQDHAEPEVLLAVILPSHQRRSILQAMHQAHPYEEVAFQVIALQNAWQEVGSGMVGTLREPMEVKAFLHHVKSVLGGGIRYTEPVTTSIQKVAICGGSGSFLLEAAMASGADAFITADVKYHRFFDADGKIMVVDVGHFESEQFTSELMAQYLSEKFTTFAVLPGKVSTNPVRYL